jgi:hypothetical protein
MTKDLVATYDKLIARACDIASVGFRMYCDHEEFARLSIEGDTATLMWPEAQSGYYNSCSIETQAAKFPAALLDLSADDYAVWQKSELTKRAAKAAEEVRQQDALMVMREKAALAELKRKYPNG